MTCQGLENLEKIKKIKENSKGKKVLEGAGRMVGGRKMVANTGKKNSQTPLCT